MKKMISELSNVFTKKQQETLITFINEKPKIMILYGAKRAGKTYVALFCFLMLVEKFKNKNVRFILGGNTFSSIKRNILDDLETLIGKPINLTKDNSFKLFGNNISVVEGSNAASYKKVRG
jgi:predicted AAA+ superfamily ATPase